VSYDGTEDLASAADVFALISPPAPVSPERRRDVLQVFLDVLRRAAALDAQPLRNGDELRDPGDRCLVVEVQFHDDGLPRSAWWFSTECVSCELPTSGMTLDQIMKTSAYGALLNAPDLQKLVAPHEIDGVLDKGSRDGVMSLDSTYRAVFEALTHGRKQYKQGPPT
jgi:hypothetical protein